MTAASNLTLSVEPDASLETQSRVRALLEEANTEFGYTRNERQFIAVLRDSTGAIQGGIKAQGYWEWLYVAELVVTAPWRGRGYGRQLLTAAENWGVLQSSCRRAWLQTLSFQARAFYEHAGYQIFAELPNYPEKQVRLFMSKALVKDASGKQVSRRAPDGIGADAQEYRGPT